MFQVVVAGETPLLMTPFQTVEPNPRMKMVRLFVPSRLLKLPLMVSSAPPSRLLLMNWSLLPACFCTLAPMVIGC